MADMMTFPDTVEEFMEEYKLVDTEQVYTNGTELVPIFRMKQWFEHEAVVRTKNTVASNDCISRQDAIDAVEFGITYAKVLNKETGEVMELFKKSNEELQKAVDRIEALPSANSKQLQILADVLDGCPLTQPCDKMWRGGWCEEHCKNNKLQEPNAECWLKYAEVMASEQ